MDKCKKILSLFNKRIKVLYLNGFTEYQILKEIRVFYGLEDEDKLSFLENTKVNNLNNEEIVNKKIVSHFCSKIYIEDNIDYKFKEINKICENVNYDNLPELKLIDDLLDNPRIDFVEDITLSNSISIFEKPFNGQYISKASYLELINGIYNDCKNNKDKENEDNLLLFENAFKNIDFSISLKEDRIEIYQELTILLSKLSDYYNFNEELITEFFKLYSIKFIRDLIKIDDYKYIFKVIRLIYSNTSYKVFTTIFPNVIENFPSKLLTKIILKFEKDIFLTNSNKNKNVLSKLILNCDNKDFLIKTLNSDKEISSFEKNFTFLEYSLNFDNYEAIEYYFEKIKFDRNYHLYKDLLININKIVENFDKIENLEKKILKINEHNYNELIIEVEQLNYFDRIVYSCCINRVINSFLNKKEFNFYYLLLLLSLGLKDKAIIYFYNNITYLKFNNQKEIFMYANILFFCNFFSFSLELLIRLKENLESKKKTSSSSLYSYIKIELELIDLLMIPKFNKEKTEKKLSKKKAKEIV